MTNPPPADADLMGLADELEQLARVAWPTPWRVGRQTGAPADHIIDFGEPPSAPYFRLHFGAKSIAARPFGVLETDDEAAEAARAATAKLIVAIGNNLPSILAALCRTPSPVADEAVVERVAKALRDLAMKRALREHGPGQMIPWQAFEEDAIAALQQVQTVDGLERVREE